METSDVLKFEKFTKELSTLHLTLVGGLFVIIVAFLVFSFIKYVFDFSNTEDFYIYLSLILAIGGPYLGKYVYDKKLIKIKELSTLDEKLSEYRGVSFSRHALIEGPALISVVIGMTTENLFFITISVILLGYLFLQKVSKDKIVEELGLDSSILIRKDQQ